MQTTTREVIRTALRCDATVDAAERRRILAAAEGEATSPTHSTVRVLRHRAFAERLGVTTRTLSNLVRTGKLRPIKLPGRSRALGFAESDLADLIGGAP